MGRTVQLKNLHNAYKIDDRLVRRIVALILKYCKKPSDVSLEIVFLTNKKIRQLNKKFKGSDRATDVLSFDLGGRMFGTGPFLGEAFISIDKAAENSKVFGTKFEEEIALYIIHAILHLFGYDDGTLKERVKMERRQKEILKFICKREDLSKVLTPR